MDGVRGERPWNGEPQRRGGSPRVQATSNGGIDGAEPPDDFRQLSVYPTSEDIVATEQPYLRPIIACGPYRDANHYLDVLVRLLREDFVRPLREGCAEYCQPNWRKTPFAGGRARDARHNVRIYENVRFDKLLTQDERVRLELEFDPEERLKYVTWEHSRRLIKGALLVLSRDASFSPVVLVSVCARNVDQLAKGRVTVELCGSPFCEDLFQGTFLMVECVTLLGPYLHPLRVLQSLDEASLPMKEYLVRASTARVRPVYIVAGQALAYELPSPSGDIVLDDVTRLDAWPSAESLGLDESQRLALQGALTNKLMLVQGPPGTGKTFLAIQVAKTLLQNRYLWLSSTQPRPLLVLCVTEHALDQFLMGLMPVTNSLIRVGGSRSNSTRFRGERRPRDITGKCWQKLLAADKPLQQKITKHMEKVVKLKEVHDSVQASYALLRHDAGLLHPGTLYSFGVITKGERDFFRKQPIQVWLVGELAVPGNELTQLVWKPYDLDLSCVKGTELALRKSVTLAISRQMLEEAEDLATKEDDAERVQILRRYWAAIQAGLAAPENQRPKVLERDRDLAEMTPVERWQKYRFWRNQLMKEFAVCANKISARYCDDYAHVIKDCRMLEDHTIMANHLVIGMTTSSAAARHSILKQLRPRIVIVEEAAEVLEAALLAALPPDVDHLVMIGDHQQLRPSTSVEDLARKYHLDVSLFERLVRNRVHCVTLNTQHRMRPEIAKLICPHIYLNLLNHDSVNSFPDIRGVTKNVFFIDHQHPEEQPTYLEDSNSFQNPHEVHFVSALVRYLVLQGYEPSKITVLCTYKGQLYYLTKQVLPAAPHLREVRITTVDEYQGEENDIVVLSLVRSNPRSNLGYVGIENRACVALSRARHGFFVIGNMSTLASRETVWKAVEVELQRQQAVGPKLMLRCEIHGQLTAVSTAEDFAQCPQGGCMRRCGVELRCGHVCPQVCHPDDMEHVKYKCLERCTRQCQLGHCCSASCYEDCPPCATPASVKATLPCGHTATMLCYKDPKKYVCKQKKSCKPCRKLRQGCRANHKCRRRRGEDCEPCDEEVTKTLSCGHSRRMTCSSDPVAELCTVKVANGQPCGQSLSEACKVKPLADLDCLRTMGCGHRCSNKRHEPCGPCPSKSYKILPRCGHIQPVPCSLDKALFTDCAAPCERVLACGHGCALKCGAACVCTQLVPYPGRPACGHGIMVPCSSDYAPDSLELLSLCSRRKCKRTAQI